MRHVYFIPFIFCLVGTIAAELRGGKHKSVKGNSIEIAGGNEDFQIYNFPPPVRANRMPFNQQHQNPPSDERILGIHDSPDGKDTGKILNNNNNSGETAPELLEILHNHEIKTHIIPPSGVCGSDTRQCPDRSTVGRVFKNNCQFRPCPPLQPIHKLPASLTDYSPPPPLIHPSAKD